MKPSKRYPFDPDHPVRPGEVLREHLLERKISRKQTALCLRVSLFKIHHLIYGDSKITAKDALGLERLLGEPAEYWLKLEMTYRLHLARKKANA